MPLIGSAGLAAVVTIVPNTTDQTYDGVDITDALVQLEELGADVVGLNCYRGPDTILPVIKEVRKKCKVQPSYFRHNLCIFDMNIEFKLVFHSIYIRTRVFL